MMPLRIMTRDFNLLDEVDRYSSLQITRKWHGIGEIDLVINRYLKGADKLQRGCIVFPHNHLDKGYIIRHKEIQLDENGKATENWSIKALSLKSWIGQRLAYPKSYEGGAESVIHQLILDNVTDPIDSKRKMPDTVLADNLQRGKNVKLSTHYENLSEVIEDLSLQSGLGWNIEIDFESKKFIFKVLEGSDLTVNQSDLPPAIFSTEFGTLGSMSYMESDLDYKSVAIVEGPDLPDQNDVPDEEKEKYMATVGDSEGFERYEMLVGANVDTEQENEQEEREQRPDEDILADMVEAGETELAENTQEIYVEGQALMGRVTEKVPKKVEGTFDDVYIDVDKLEVLFVSPYQTVEDTDPITISYPPINLTKVGRYEGSVFTWGANEPTGTRATIQYSLDDINWFTLKNGESIDIEKDARLNGKTLHIRQVLKLSDFENLPSITNFNYAIEGYHEREKVSTARIEYQKDYDLGDMSTLQNKDWGITMDARITEVKEIYEPGNIKIDLTFDNSFPTLIDKIKKELKKR